MLTFSPLFHLSYDISARLLVFIAKSSAITLLITLLFLQKRIKSIAFPIALARSAQ
jgi:hypothetical protein